MTDNQKLCTIHLLNYLALASYLAMGLFSFWHFIPFFISTFLLLNIGIICGYHRFFTHSSFTVSRFVKISMLYFGTLASVGAVIGWVAVHRKHHRYSDTENDPHSPVFKGWFRVWFGYFYNIYEVEGKYGAKLARDPDILFFQKYYYSIILSTVALLFLISPVFAIVAYCIPQLVSLHATSAINVLTHITGEVKNSKTLGFLIFGEGWHADHHKSPMQQRLDKYDLSGLTIEHILSRRKK